MDSTVFDIHVYMYVYGLTATYFDLDKKIRWMISTWNWYHRAVQFMPNAHMMTVNSIIIIMEKKLEEQQFWGESSNCKVWECLERRCPG